jgi:putative flippase GtrA
MYSYVINYLAENRLQLIKFIIVGFLTLGINLGCFHFFYDYLLWDYRIAVSMAYVLAVITHFSLHRLVTFQATDQDFVNNTWKYLTMLALNYVVMFSIVWCAVNIAQVSPYIGLIASTAITMVINFLVMRHFVFKIEELA